MCAIATTCPLYPEVCGSIQNERQVRIDKSQPLRLNLLERYLTSLNLITVLIYPRMSPEVVLAASIVKVATDTDSSKCASLQGKCTQI